MTRFRNDAGIERTEKKADVHIYRELQMYISRRLLTFMLICTSALFQQM